MVTSAQLEIISQHKIPEDMTRDEVNRFCAYHLANLYLHIHQGKKLQVIDEDEPTGWYTYENIVPFIDPFSICKWRVAPEKDDAV